VRIYLEAPCGAVRALDDASDGLARREILQARDGDLVAAGDLSPGQIDQSNIEAPTEEKEEGEERPCRSPQGWQR
jgi:hypothetical protein